MNTHQISDALQMGLQMLVQVARQSGRTTRMLNGLKNGDRIITCDARHARLLKEKVRQRGLDVEVMAWPLEYGLHEHVSRLTRCAGRTVFDHTFMEEFWKYQLKRSTAEWMALEEKVSEKSNVPDCCLVRSNQI